MAGSHKVHGAPLGDEEVKATRRAIGVPENESFFVDPEAVSYFEARKPAWSKKYDEWKALFDSWAAANPELKKEWDAFFNAKPDYSTLPYPTFAEGEKIATRAASGKVLQAISPSVTNLVGGSADLAPSNNTAIPFGSFSVSDRKGRTLHFGVREHAMGGIVNGMALHGFRPFAATFLVFADYMRPAIRLSALMGLPVIYILTHDSIYVGEDGPTHEPVEHITSLRVIPKLMVLRPGDAQETALAWQIALEHRNGPTALALTRQNLTVYPKADADWKNTARKGAYIVKNCEGTPDVTVVATGSEVELALKAAELVKDRKIRVVSMISRDQFLKQDSSFRDSIVPKNVRTVVAEAGVRNGWEGFVKDENDILSIEDFGKSGKAEDVAKSFGFTKENLASIIRR